MFPALQRTYLFRSTLTVLPFFCTLMFSQQASAEKVSTEEWNISADKVIRYEDPNSIVAQGNVILEKKEKLPPPPPQKSGDLSSWSELLGEAPPKDTVIAEQVEQTSIPQYETTVTIRADWMVYDVELESIKAKGNLKISTKEDTLSATEGTLNLLNETGKFEDATVVRQEKSLHLEGKTIEKTGFDSYRILDGWVITCKVEDGETPPWSFKSASTEVKENGYAVLKHATFNIKDVPILYTPYFIVPVKNTRQTGFLFPEFSHSSNSGFGFNLPFFVNISDSTDVTLFPEYYQKRGFMPGIEFRYASGVTDMGTFTANYLDDNLSDPSETDYYSDTGYTHDNSDRYWLRGKANQNFGEWQSRLDVDIVSDEDYLSEFNSGYTGFDSSEDRYIDEFGRGFQNKTENLRENSFKVLRSWGGISLAGTMFAVNDADTTDVTDDGDDTTVNDDYTSLWKLPSIDFQGTLPVSSTSLTFDWNADYVNYWREEGTGGHRFDIKPAISSSIPLGSYLESRAEVSVRDTYYVIEEYGDAVWTNDDTQNRLIPAFETEVATTLERDFFKGASAFRSYNHQLRPFVKYDYIPDVDQDELPDWDDVDAIDTSNAITYGIDNFFETFKTASNNVESSRDYAFLKIEQNYDLSNDASDEPFGDIYTRLGWYPITRASLTYKNYFDVYETEFNSHTFEGSYRNSRGDYISLDYSFKEESDIEQINADLMAYLFYGWSVGAGIEHSIFADETTEAKGSLTYQALCWSVKFETRYTPEDTTYLVVFNLANIGIPLGVDF